MSLTTRQNQSTILAAGVDPPAGIGVPKLLGAQSAAPSCPALFHARIPSGRMHVPPFLRRACGGRKAAGCLTAGTPTRTPATLAYWRSVAVPRMTEDRTMKPTPLQSRVLRHIAARPPGVSDRDLFEHFRHLPTETVLRAVRALVGSGQVETSHAFTWFKVTGGAP